MHACQLASSHTGAVLTADVSKDCGNVGRATLCQSATNVLSLHADE
jgi:hypothetical protein